VLNSVDLWFFHGAELSVIWLVKEKNPGHVRFGSAAKPILAQPSKDWFLFVLFLNLDLFILKEKQ
jgi:hypothetical protein